MSRTSFASSFAPYTPPPDDPSYPSSSRHTSRAWPPRASSQQPMSYQSGAVPTFNTSQAGGPGAVEEAAAESGAQIWETRFGARVDILAAFAYLLGPISALLLLILETDNDYVRFHAYQSALLSTPLILLRILASLLQFPSFMRTILTLIVAAPLLYMTWQAYIDAARNGLVRFQLPWIGPMADRWVSEE
ncbi:uncharacterized protein LAESUDRAFT_762613 [Laetiporus sulphureus 93-53]|uniref:Uncharacterized protein n=1 Tax=Laetiporus sulphureus 93-53 TaxID=1314785 RepID=A0A165CFQ1_9APHY|nr:uncharacterized protein LAESUDRAFT_762613 [Laetiporus sulphureus 93-53]KZT02728.1 hypothetical protein LAESUDRAFT_762613 [Laetiporus sulphureus 93-53]